MIARNKLFILPTDRCGLNCAFCSYAESRKEHSFPEIDINKGHAKESIESLVNGAQAVVFSGGGEPLLNMNMLKETMNMEENKRFIITTGIGKSLEKLEEDFETINAICKEKNSTCAIRISLDHFHADQINYEEKLSKIIKWFADNKWEACNRCFFRTTFVDKEFVDNVLRTIAEKEKWEYKLIDESAIVTKAMINGKEFRIVMRPTINPEKFKVTDKYNLKEYLDVMDSLNKNSKFFLGKPQGCRVCRGCFGKEDNGQCDLMDDLDVTITAKGDVYLYGAELSVLGNIYEEHVTFDLIKERMRLIPEYEILQKYTIREVIESLLQDEKIGPLVEKVNYPYAIMRNLLKEHEKELKTILNQLNNEK